MTELVLTADALADIRDVTAYLTKRAGEQIALRYAVRIRSTLREIGTDPGIGARRSQLGRNIRFRTVRPYAIFYRYADDTVVVLRVLHERRKITRKLLAAQR